MEYVIKNRFLEVVISSYGAEMQSVRKLEGNNKTEYLWQGDEKTWKDRAIQIFPYVARLTEGKYCYRGQEYHMENHGFVPYSELCTEQTGEDRIRFFIEADEHTKKIYPFDFRYEVEYVLKSDQIHMTYRVENRGKDCMYFGIGAHPGFQVPLGDEGCFEDYVLEFDRPKEVKRIGMSETCFVTGEDKNYSLEDNVRLRLRHEVFDQDAVILKGMRPVVTLRSDKSNRSVTVEYPKMKYLGIWQWPHSKAAYVCIEPWSSLPSRQDVIEDLDKQENLEKLFPGGIYENAIVFTIR